MNDGDRSGEPHTKEVNRRRFLHAAAGAALGLGVGETRLATAQTGEDRVIWRFETGDRVRSSPTIVDGTVYFGSRDGNAYAVDASDGTEVWSFEADGDVVTSTTVVNGKAYFGSEDDSGTLGGGGKVYVLDASDGTEQWSYGTAGSVSSLTVADNTVYVATGNGNLRALDASDGTEGWNFTMSGVVTSAPIVANGTLYIGSEDGSMYALDASDGAEVWSFGVSQPVLSAPTVADGLVHFGSEDDNFYTLNTSDGGVEWVFETGRVVASPTVADGTVYVASTDGTLYALESTEGTENWVYTPENSGSVYSSPTVVGNVVYFSSGGDLHAVEASDGSKRWSYDLPALMGISSPTVVDGVVYIGSGSNMYALDAGVSGSSEGSRVMLGTLGHHDDLRGESVTGSGSQDAQGETTDGAETDSLSGQGDTTDGTESGADEPAGSDRNWFLYVLGAVGLAGGGYGGYKVVASSDDEDKDGDGKTIQKHTSQPTEPFHSESGTRAEIGHDERIPESVPDSPAVSLTYDGIQKREKVGSGGNADVYRATSDTSRGKITFALKEPRVSGTLHTETAERLMQEAETWSKIDDHDHIVGVVDYGSEPLPWIAMEYMDGGHIGEQAGEMDFNRALWTAIVTTEAVRHAHRRGVAHLDLKPENVLFRSVDDNNVWEVPKVADWGLSKHLLEHSKSVEGLSPQYSAPEQFDDSYGAADDITDVYQLGAVLYELFTGQPPFEGDPARVMNKVMNEEPTPPSEVADVPKELDEILLTAMATEKQDRYETVIYLRDALQELR